MDLRHYWSTPSDVLQKSDHSTNHRAKNKDKWKLKSQVNKNIYMNTLIERYTIA